MATLSRVGSQKSGLLSIVQIKSSTKINSDHTNALRRPSYSEEQSLVPPPGYVPVLLAGLQLPGEKPGSFPTLQSQNSAPHSEVARAGELIDPLTQTTRFGNDSKMMSLSNDMERVMKEQSELEQLREQLEESKRKLQSEDISESAVQSVQ
ncbi:hypothetical protein PsorP6_018895 [Peronosclerospora sorghi]|nr:hypothetical protein PsorP6_018895 [Peronosclerospora sorghi]